MPHESRSSPREIQNYLGRISGPLLDRVDLHVEVPQVKFVRFSGDGTEGLPHRFANELSRPANVSRRDSMGAG
jgi:predicted ATPase with chaperone activity